MQHIQQTITDLEFLIGELQRSAGILRNLATNGGLPSAPTLGPAPVLAPAAARETPQRASAKPARTMRRAASGRGQQNGIGAAVREVLPQFGQSWFSVEAVKEAIHEKYPGKFAEGKLKDVSVRLIGGVNRWLESQGTGRDRRYRNLPAAPTAGESYEARKAQLLG